MKNVSVIQKVDFNVVRALDFIERESGRSIEYYRENVKELEVFLATKNLVYPEPIVINDFIERILAQKKFINIDLNVDKVYGVEEIRDIPGLMDGDENMRGYRVWFSNKESDCWWVSMESYNRVRGIFYGDARICCVPVKDNKKEKKAKK